jgi:hypothetical protein
MDQPLLMIIKRVTPVVSQTGGDLPSRGLPTSRVQKIIENKLGLLNQARERAE